VYKVELRYSKTNPEQRWGLREGVFFARGACHILAYACLPRSLSAASWIVHSGLGRKLGQVGTPVEGKPMPGGFNPITGIGGIRHAVRPQSVRIIHDADECREETMI
jgi:hypothetical protein